MDILIQNARLRGYEKLHEIAIDDGTITALAPTIKTDEPPTQKLDAEGRLVAPTFIDPHLHLDKALISEVVRENCSGTLDEAIEIIWEKKRRYTLDDIAARATRVIEWAVQNGTTKLRSHVDVDTIGGLKPLEGVVRARERCADIADVQIVAFPQEGIIQDEGAKELMYQAMENGADVVGGMPYNEMLPEDSHAHIDFAFDLAKRFDADIDMHVDETDDPSARTLQYLAAKTLREGYPGRVTAGHTCALAAYNDYYAQKVIGMVKRAEVHMITNPATNLMLEGRRDHQPIRRGITRVKELLAAGVNLSYGQDCLKDTFYPTWGRADPLEVGMILAHAAQFTTPSQIETLFDLPTVNASKILGLERYGIAVGNPADLTILDATTVQEAFRTLADRRWVIRKGRIVATTRTERWLTDH